MSPDDSRPRRRSAIHRWAARVAAVGVLAVLATRFGADPFVAGVAHLTPAVALAALGLTALATVAAAWRWSAISRALGVRLPLRAAVPAYYRSQLLNTVLPGGVTGDVARGLDGGAEGRLRRLQVVAWDRGTGQIVQLGLVAVLLGVTSPGLLGLLLGVTSTVALLVAGVLLLIRRRGPGPTGGRIRRLARGFRNDLRAVLVRPAVLVPIVIGSAVVALAHAAVFVLAAMATGASVDLLRLLPLALVVQAATVLPTGFGGFGAREGVAAALFAGAGLGAAHGVAAAIASGTLALLAVLPGLVPLVTGRVRPDAALAGHEASGGWR